jgi:hypothetical protein
MESKDVESDDFKEELLTDLSYLCTFGLENPLRVHVDEDVSLIKYGQKKVDQDAIQEGGANQQSSGAKKTRKQNMVNVRMITGDHFETARYVAYKAGIINKHEKDGKDVVMTGE